MWDRLGLQRHQKESEISGGAKQSTFTLDTFQGGCGWPADQGRIILWLGGGDAGGSKYDGDNPGKDLPQTGSLPVEVGKSGGENRKGVKGKTFKLESLGRASGRAGRRRVGVGAPACDVSSLLD